MFCSPQALLLGTAQPSPAVPHCSASPGQLCRRLQLPTSSSHSPGQCSLRGFHIGEEQRWKRRQHSVISGSPMSYWKLLPNVPCTASNCPGWHPFCDSACHPKGMGTLGTPITPELPSSFGFHSDESALKCQRHQSSAYISWSMAMSWSAALGCCVGWSAVLHFISLWALHTNKEMRAVGAGTVQP